MNILVALDLSPSSPKIVGQVKELFNFPSVKFWLLHVADPEPEFIGYGDGPQYIRDAVAQGFHEEHRAIQALAEEMRGSQINCTSLLIQGYCPQTILVEAQRLQVDLIVMGSHGKNVMTQLILGSTSQAVIKDSTIPVLLVPNQSVKHS